MNATTIIFDLDGTLVHTKKEFIIDVVRKTVGYFDIEDVPEKDIYKFWFGQSRKLIENWDINPVKFWEIFHKQNDIKLRKKYTIPFEDCWVLEKLNEKKVKIAILTGSTKKLADMEIELIREKFNISFDEVVSSHDIGKFKPNPKAVVECLNVLKSKKENTLLVGNSDEDIMAAQTAGILDIYIDRREHEITTKPTKTIKSLEELLDIIKG
ncbi:HAD family hydrolase [Candidatus Aenigmatarchaeota archaeon]